MDTTLNLASLGLELPGPSYLVGALIFGLIGYVGYRRGRHTSRPALTWTGVGLMVYPYAISQTWALWLVGAILCGWLYMQWNG